MKSTLKQTKLEELNVVFVENFANTFFTRLVDSYYEFVQIFKDQKSTFTKFIVWMSIEIEKLITILHNQQYISVTTNVLCYLPIYFISSIFILYIHRSRERETYTFDKRMD
jgi:hypothetical protein